MQTPDDKEGLTGRLQTLARALWQPLGASATVEDDGAHDFAGTFLLPTRGDALGMS